MSENYTREELISRISSLQEVSISVLVCMESLQATSPISAQTQDNISFRFLKINDMRLFSLDLTTIPTQHQIYRSITQLCEHKFVSLGPTSGRKYRYFLTPLGSQVASFASEEIGRVLLESSSED